MGKNQHSKDRLFLTATEWRETYGGVKKGAAPTGYKRLPFNCCALTFTEFETPVCTRQGSVYDIVSVIPYIAKHKRDPVTGSPLGRKDLISLTYHKSKEGKYHCPMTFRSFNNNSHIVAIATTGNVYSYEAVKELNIKVRNFRDLLTDEPFKKSDIIHLQDPQNMSRQEYSNFHHCRPEAQRAAIMAATAAAPKMRTNAATERVLSEAAVRSKRRAALEEAQGRKKKKTPQAQAAAAAERSTFTSGACSGSFTSTAMAPVTRNELALASQEEVRERRWTRLRRMGKKGYVRLSTSLGDLNLELHFDQFPRTCENFITLAKSGYYDGTIFHRLIPEFMIQGGDPEGTGRGGDSIWGGPFKDEFHNKYRHTERGVLSMANSGPNTNKSQFFITFKPTPNLDNIHAVFGRVVGGMETLGRMEKVPTRAKDGRPLESVTLRSCTVFQNPVDDLSETEEQREERQKAEAAAKEAEAEHERVVKVNGEWKVVSASSAAAAAYEAAQGAGGGAAAAAASRGAAGERGAVGRYIKSMPPPSRVAGTVGVASSSAAPKAAAAVAAPQAGGGAAAAAQLRVGPPARARPKKTAWGKCDFSGW